MLLPIQQVPGVAIILRALFLIFFCWLVTAQAAGAPSCPKQLASAAKAEKSSADYWREVGLGFDSLSAMVNNKQCFVGELEFRMCLAALEALLAQAAPRLTVAPLGVQLPEPFGSAVKSFGPVTVVELKEQVATQASFAEEFTRLRQLDISLQQTWTNLYESGVRVDFEAALDFCRQFVSSADIPIVVPQAFNRALALADSHSRIEPAAQVHQRTETSSSNFAGIGVSFTETAEGFVVHEVMPRSPALAAGVQMHDIVVRIDGEAVRGLRFEEVLDRVRGAEGTTVKIIFKRAGVLQDLVITRAKIDLPNVELKIHETAGGKVAWITLGSFMSSSASEDVGRAIREGETNGVRGYVLDLRGNGGGLMDEASDIIAHFVGPDKRIYLLRPTNPEDQSILNLTDKPQLTTKPLVILVDRASASASELLSGVLRDLKRAYIVGERTFGKGTMQEFFRVGEVPGPFFGKPVVLFKTQAMFFTPSGRSNQLHGITPDFEVLFKPDMTEAEKFALRESDHFPNAVPNPLGPPPRRSPEELRAIEDCLRRTAAAAAIYAGRQPSSLPRDNQLLHAVDVLNCL